MKQENASKPLWTYYFARKFSASRFELVMRVFFSDFYRREFGVRLKNNLVIPHDGNHAIYHEQTEWSRFARAVYRKTCGRFTDFSRYVRLIKQTQRAALRATEAIARQPLERFDWAQIGQLWRRWDRAHFEHFLKPIWIPFIIEPLLSEDVGRILRGLERRRGTEERFADDLEVIFTPDQPNAITQERISLMTIAVREKQGKLNTAVVTKALKRHEQRFGFIPCYDVIDRPWTSTDFRKEFQVLLRMKREALESELQQIKQKFRERPRQFRKLLTELHPNARERASIIMAHEIAFIKDERDDYRRRLSWTVQPLFREIARRARLPFRAPLYVLKDEMEAWFRTGDMPISKQQLLERVAGYALVRLNSGATMAYSGTKMQEFIARQRFAQAETRSSELRGVIGNRGVAKGIARIVRTKHDLKWVQPGNILIAVTTNPDYVPVMRRCRAFVTDEGGLTSHAAIVARELHIPCLVGTKTATVVFRNGDRVEVDATKGIVRKLEA